MKLHYSQTGFLGIAAEGLVSVPYEITLLSNVCKGFLCIYRVSVPYEITLLSNMLVVNFLSALFQYLMKLHYSQTLFGYGYAKFMFQYLMKLHYSQTVKVFTKRRGGFSTL